MSKKNIVSGLLITLFIVAFAPVLFIVSYLVGRPSSLPPMRQAAVYTGVVMAVAIIYLWIMFVIGDKRSKNKEKDLDNT